MDDRFFLTTKDASGAAIHPDVIYTTDSRGFPVWSSRMVEADGRISISGVKSEPFGVMILWEVPGFGKIMLTADNEGKGFRSGSAADFRLEAAKTRAMTTKRRLDEYSSTAFPTDLRQKASSAIERIGNARASDVDALDSSLSELLWAGEEIELIQARANLSAMDDERRRSFLFGSAYFDASAPEEFNRRFADLLNFATTPFYRARLEPKKGHLNWQPIDAALDWLDARNIPAKGHPLFWLHRAGVPDWMHALGFEDLKEVVHQQIFDTVTRYKDRIKIWDVINEAHDPVEANVLDYTQEMRIEMTALASQAVREADPHAVRIVNVNRHWGYYRGEWETRNPLHPIEYLEELAARNIDYEVLGIQMYHGGIGHWVRDMMDQSIMMDRYIPFGKPIHISEIQSPSSMAADSAGRREIFNPGQAGWWHRPWDPETQADWVEQFYSIAVAKKEIEAITWWSLSDRSTFWPSGGLLDINDRPKPAYTRLKDLIRGFTRP